MIVQSFRSVIWVGAVAGAAIGCYMVSLRVASERARLESVEARILLAKRDIRSLDTELTTRGRVRQLERWNEDVLALGPPTEGQFLQGEVQLAGLPSSTPREEGLAVEGGPAVRMASAADDASAPDAAKVIPAEYRTSGPAREDPLATGASLLVRASAPRAAAERETAKPAKSAAKPAARDEPTARRTPSSADKLKTKLAARGKTPPARKVAGDDDKAVAAKKAKAGKAL